MFLPLINKIKAHPTIYASKDIERALGVAPQGEYFILAGTNDFSQKIKKLFPKNVFLFENPENNTLSLLREKSFDRVIKENDIKNIIFFKDSTLLEKTAKKYGLKVLNPNADLAEKIENKISQTKWLGKLAKKYLPPHFVTPIKNVKWEKRPIVLQWGHGHTGDSTVLINSQKELNSLIKKFPERDARITNFIKGPSFTLNVVVAKNKILFGNVSYQITGLAPFTDNPWATIGNDWSIPCTLLSQEEIDFIQNMAKEVGGKMKKDGWLGLFGIDIIYDEEKKQIFLLEINARQPASTTYESQIQEWIRQYQNQINIFEAHLLALLGEKIDAKMIEINDGAQIIQRITKDISTIDPTKIESLQKAGYSTISYTNKEINSDLIRIQSKKGIMEGHEKFNSRGKEIIEILK